MTLNLLLQLFVLFGVSAFIAKIATPEHALYSIVIFAMLVAASMDQLMKKPMLNTELGKNIVLFESSKAKDLRQRMERVRSTEIERAESLAARVRDQ